ncbi:MULTISPECIES: transcriptional regulator GcvA [Alteromonas]|jgi:LysR family glycine cleavage system transcriptional activator|uniref:LysR family transcriptional regulator n=2 Tax=Alteromonas stellipolaris TaxID=233316 RepID=A0AAW7Z3J4_9ALTE|nr:MULTISPECIES: transcriptional regulator GcvA [Alteromonas]AMJ91510.1 LysR family transcriptional regulator [Alteromonas sp. Mac2]ALM89666.1 transcriptional regulator, LysR [Alteromonas stellipolaris LMG 21856]AMJ75241.1 LysR family transcriptional regulator [Alteromonas stellipolaris]AMJ87647.1 LysR family transcriptional regulator [Alteromonas sp. Mac1]ANB21641.1 LysR family transcriptional regulator [Alteromonas stellipolaris]
MKSPIHLNALKAFEASARHQSFSAAAQELNVTPAAVGQLVKTLEEWLDTALFHRMSSGKTRLIATETAQSALPLIREGFDKLAQGVDILKDNAISGALTVAVSPAFAAKWLLPRLHHFQAICAQTNVNLNTNLKPVDFASQRIDVGIRFGVGTWQGLRAEKLMDEEVYPVCSPTFLDDQSRLNSVEGLLNETLIHDQSMDAHTGFPSWSSWLKKAGVSGPFTTKSIQINNSAAVLQSAIDGHGVALARSVMAKDDVAAGRLVRLFPNISFQSPLAYYVVYRHECADLPRIQAFKDWLFKEVEVATAGK